MVRTIARPRRAQLSIRRDRRNYDPSIAGLGTDRAQRYFVSDFDRLSLVRRYRDRSGRNRSRQRGTSRHCTGPAGTAMEYWIEGTISDRRAYRLAIALSAAALRAGHHKIRSESCECRARHILRVDDHHAAAWLVDHLRESAANSRRTGECQDCGADDRGIDRTKVQFRFPPPLYLYGTIPWALIKPIENIGDTPDGIIFQAKLDDNLVAAHAMGGLLMFALLLLHVAGALKHQFLDGQTQFARMGLGRTRTLKIEQWARPDHAARRQFQALGSAEGVALLAQGV